MSVLIDLDWEQVRSHYDERVAAHERLVKLHDGGLLDPFARLLLGISDGTGNYSAAEHGLGPKVLKTNGPNVLQRIHDLATAFRKATKARDVPTLITTADLSFLGIGVGSEASCMVNPSICWVANTRSIWTHLVIEHKGSVPTADEALELYRDKDASSKMQYAVWTQIHGLLGRSMTKLAKDGADLAAEEDVEPGEITFLWADAIASALYSHHHGRGPT